MPPPLDEFRAEIAATVRAELARRGKNQRDLAAHLGMAPEVVSLRCRGERSFRAEELVAVAAWLDIPLTLFTVPARVTA